MKVRCYPEKSLDQKEKPKNMSNFSEDFEMESKKDSVYLLEEQALLMKEINEEELDLYVYD